jgi:hypothetical protein
MSLVARQLAHSEELLNRISLTACRTTGGATLKAPAGGFGDQKVSALFFPPPVATGSAATPSPTSSNETQSSKKKKNNNSGEVAGIAIGAVALLALLGGMAIFLISRKRTPKTQFGGDPEKKSGAMDSESCHELHGNQYAELEGKHDYNELPTNVTHHELPADERSVELDAKSSVP